MMAVHTEESGDLTVFCLDMHGLLSMLHTRWYCLDWRHGRLEKKCRPKRRSSRDTSVT